MSTYTGKYPRNVQSIASAGKEFIARLNDGSFHKVGVTDIHANCLPKIGTDFDLWQAETKRLYIELLQWVEDNS